MRSIYLDRQVIIDSYTGVSEVQDAIQRCMQKGFVFPYSPAHVEEIVGAFSLGKINDLEKQIKHLNEISKGLAIMPCDDGEAELREEDISECLSRVKDNGGRNQTDFAVSVERLKMQFIKAQYNSDERQWKKIRKRVEKLSPDAVLGDPDVIKYFHSLGVYQLTGNAFFERLSVINKIFDALDAFGFSKEHKEEKVENKLHDASHAIYASYSNVFVTNDEKLRKRSMVAYSFIGLRTRILDKDGFILFSREC